jgi:dipeptidyl aminopeptidase/acylaminoacyl peptidase
LKRRGPAPQAYRPEKPPKGVRIVEYPSGDLKLKGWLTADPGDGKRHPAVVFLHGGWSFAADDWHDAAPFAQAGFVLFMPMLRAENGNPGIYEGFYREVDDAIAAGRFVAALPFVDADNVFVAGHSVGAVLTVLVAMMPSPYKAGAALSGYLDMPKWATVELEERVVFDARDPEEVRLRNPLAFVASLRIPLTLYAEPAMRSVNEPFATRAKQLGKECKLVIVPGDHQTMVAPSVAQSIYRFRDLAKK